MSNSQTRSLKESDWLGKEWSIDIVNTVLNGQRMICGGNL